MNYYSSILSLTSHGNMINLTRTDEDLYIIAMTASTGAQCARRSINTYYNLANRFHNMYDMDIPNTSRGRVVHRLSDLMDASLTLLFILVLTG